MGAKGISIRARGFQANRPKGTSRDSNLAEKLDNRVPEPNNPIEFKSIYESKAQQFIETSLISKDTKIIGTSCLKPILTSAVMFSGMLTR